MSPHTNDAPNTTPAHADACAPAPHRARHRWSIGVKVALVTTLAVIGACSSTTDGGLVGADRRQLLLVSEPEINTMAQQAYAKVLEDARQNNTLNTNQQHLKRVQAITKRLIPQTAVFRPDAAKWKWEVNVIESKELNAWCMHGGKIAVYTGIIEQLKLTDDELAAILGHEMAHALREHSREQISQSMATDFTLNIGAALLGLGSGTASLAQVGSDLILKLPNSRAHETEADRIGVELAARAGFDPRAALSLWRKMGAASGGGSGAAWLSTHPSNEQRTQDLGVYSQRVMGLYQDAKR
jgi:Zn-dependent protease with chaperone function